MSTYVIGDIQGYFKPLMELLDHIQFNEKHDYLWFTGDLVNRGPNSLETLRFIKQLGVRAISVLGNHDLALLAVGFGAIAYNTQDFTFEDVLNAPDRDDLLHWLRFRPVVHYDHLSDALLVHAGIPPQWGLDLLLNCARELESALQSDDYFLFLSNMYGNFPNLWDQNLQGWDRLRIIANYFTRMRFCSFKGELNLEVKGKAYPSPPNLFPWFDLLNENLKKMRILFGHWASLKGECPHSHIQALDTGCSWGAEMTAFCLDNNQRYSISCKKVI
ncbi:MAG: bis(5-nucleosyl)-tetraphosphatase, symmetrical [Francisellaceae bacterium]|nr:bis(5-nucleosyl)-tetraphosphatase, symmetrical [Francisellaceae bacterium]